mmetsp:Transcript_37616/g.57634  ORF Transcript_37616/g.57634 Transcript_37616/m.57634 type:complete len:227 (+) Transcript_37616:319-999(+)
MDHNQAEGVFCKNGTQCESKQVTGNWSNIYDQSFKVELDNGLRFLTNFKYSVKAQISEDPSQDGASEFTSLKTGDYNKFDSECDRTMVGFVQTMPKLSSERYSMNQHKITCFWGEQETHYDMEKTVSVKTDSDAVKVAVITTQNKIVTEDLTKPQDAENIMVGESLSTEALSESQSTVQAEAQAKLAAQARANVMSRLRQNTRRFNAHYEHVASDENDKAISFINS